MAASGKLLLLRYRQDTWIQDAGKPATDNGEACVGRAEQLLEDRTGLGVENPKAH